MKKYFILIGAVMAVGLFFVGWMLQGSSRTNSMPGEVVSSETSTTTQIPAGMERPPHSMSIESLRAKEYPGSQFVIEQALTSGSNYKQFVVSYQSEDLKIYGLLTIPTTPKPANGYPAIVFVHGYIPPAEYVTTKNYASYQAVLARNGFVTFKPDLRGHGKSEGEPVSAHFSEKYVIDTLNAIASVQMYADVDPDRIGYWGHSNGGEIGLRSLVISNKIKAASLWAGVVGSFEDMLEKYNEKIPFLRNRTSTLLVEHGMPSTNKEFWRTIDPYFYLDSISAPIQLQHGTADISVPVELSQRLKEELEASGKSVEYYEYRGDDHNIVKNFGTAWQRTVDFFKANL